MTDFLIIEELKKAGVQIRTHSPYHFRLDESVDIWPSKNRYRHKGMTNAGDYHGLDSLMEILRDFKKQQARRAHTDRAVKKMKQGDQVLAHPFFGKNARELSIRINEALIVPGVTLIQLDINWSEHEAIALLKAPIQ